MLLYMPNNKVSITNDQHQRLLVFYKLSLTVQKKSYKINSVFSTNNKNKKFDEVDKRNSREGS